MFNKYRCAFLLIAFSSFVTAAEPDSYEKCAAIKTPSERVKCYDSLAKQSAKKQTPTATPQEKKTDQNPELRKDMQALINTPMAKGELESTSEYRERVKQLYDKYDKRTYRVVFGVKENNTDRRKLVSYDPDTEVMSVSMPELNFGTVGVQIGDKSETLRITRSFLETEPSVIKTTSYTGRNGFGREVVVEKYIATFKGLAILGSSNTNMKPQTFTASMPRDRVKDILERGKVALTIKTELLTYGEGTYLLDSWLQGKEASVLVKEAEIDRPTMKDPRDIERTRLMLPVRLISLSLLDGNGNEVIQAQGSEQDTPAIMRACQ